MSSFQAIETMLFKDRRLKKLPTVLIHLFIWLAIFSLPMLFRPAPHGFDGPDRPMPMPMPLPILMNNLFLVIAFYTNLLVIMPNVFNRERWGYFLLLTLAFLAASLLIHPMSVSLEKWLWKDAFTGGFPFDRGGRREFRPHENGFSFKQFSFVYMFLLTWTLSMAYHLFVQLQASVRRADQVLATALQSELSFLKAQVNPHFLFNTLNNIYVLAMKKSDQAPAAIMQLSNLMRKITDDSEVDFVPFEEEEQFIRDYLELQELRQNEKTVVQFEVNGNRNGLSIAPRLLIPFIDNAFKYGISAHHASLIDIRLAFTGKTLSFSIKNPIHQGNQDFMASAGVGLENAKRRLELLYKDKHQLFLNETGTDFEVRLNIELS